MSKLLGLNLFGLLSLIFLLSDNPSDSLENAPQIVAGTAKIEGTVSVPTEMNSDSIFVTITVAHPVSGENVQYEAHVDQSGKFSVDVDVETDISFVGVYTSINPAKPFLAKLRNRGVTSINVAYNSDNDIASVKVVPEMNPGDILNGLELMNKMIEYRSGRAAERLYNKSPDYFLNYAKNILSQRLEIARGDTSISKELKELLSKDFRLFLYSAHVFAYEDEMIRNIRNTKADASEKVNISKIDRAYYRFLTDFNLNDPQYLNCFTFPEVQKSILQNEIIGLPPIGDTDIPTWLAKVKAILSPLVGFSNGNYYDILTANAYARQLNEELSPLTEKQKQHIANYWKYGEIAKILFRKNQKIVELEKIKSPTVVNDVSSIPPNKVVETIVSKYKNRVVLIDLWATWCSPCLDAIQQFRAAKKDFSKKDVAFVYVTNPSSPSKLWEEKIKGIGDEHYYLNASQWEYLLNQFEFEGIPSYLLYDREGKLVNKFTGFPGIDKTKEMINALLK